MFELPVFSFVSPERFGFECGYVTVPEQHRRPDGPTLRLAVAILNSQAEDVAPDPLFMAQGGPGGSSLEIFPLLMLNSPIRAGRDIVIFDQRGTFYSEPNLLCPELDQLTEETIELDLTPAEEDRRTLEAYQACRERLVSAGINLAAFNSLENAADIEAIRVALGYERINFYGVSYGTLLGLHYMRNYPGSLQAVILDGVVPTQGSFLAEIALSADRAFKEAAQLCAADVACNTAYPDLEAVIYEVTAALNETPAAVPVTDPITGRTYQASVDGDLFLNTLFQAMYVPSLLLTLPTLVYSSRDHDYTPLSTLLGLILFQPTFSAGMYHTVVCAEEADFKPAGMPVEGAPPILARLMKEDNVLILEVCRLWDIPKLGPEVDAPVVSDIPTLLLSGHFDPITPPVFAETVAETLSNGYAYTFPDTSHGALGTTGCADRIIIDFLNDPRVRPEAGCLAAEPSRFEIPTPATVIVTPALTNVLGLFEGRNLGSAGLLLLGMSGLLSFFLIWPIAFLMGKLRKRPPRAKQPNVALGCSASGLALLTGGLSLLFVIGLIAVIFLSDEAVLFIGVPWASAPLFIIPPLLLLLAVSMLAVTIMIWLKGYWSLWRRGYYTLLTLSAIAVVGVLAQWSMLTVLA